MPRRSSFLKTSLIILMCLAGKASFADTSEDARFFISHLMGDGLWIRIQTDHRLNTERFYREALDTDNARVVDERRFYALIPKRTAQDIFDEHRTFVENITVEQFGADGLSEIVDFFQTPTGERMLSIAKDEGIFEPKYSGRYGYREVLDDWGSYLELDDFTRYSAFTSRPPGEAFIVTRQEIQDITMSTISTAPGFFEPSLEPLLEMIEADGVVEFPADFVRQNMIRDIERFLAQ
ncbi:MULTISPECIES: hypothetical protein [Rhodobacterales]|uniref:hypothetical protein n=1 Tax=Rhodobacterales TaxID=204455 RepID=UPI0011BD9AA0|nr:MULTISPECIES: hypothetical protein [Rhodobacterales]MDO6589002.1 hypothetical protein [Yoonia sp. 1_MG-2023]